MTSPSRSATEQRPSKEELDRQIYACERNAHEWGEVGDGGEQLQWIELADFLRRFVVSETGRILTDEYPRLVALSRDAYGGKVDAPLVTEARRAVEELSARSATPAPDMVPRSRYDACNADWLEAKAQAEKLNKALARLIASITKNAPPLLAITIANGAKEEA